MNLAVDEHGIDHAATIMDHDITFDLDQAGVRIDRDKGNMCRIGNGRGGRIIVRDGFEAVFLILGQ